MDDETLLENSFVVPDAALADVPATLRCRPAGRAAHGIGGELDALRQQPESPTMNLFDQDRSIE